MPLIILLGVPIVAILIVILLYNSLVGRKNQVDNAFAAIDAHLKKRHDLIPNLVEAVKAYMGHERGILNEITELRAKVLSGGVSSGERVDLENKITKALGNLMVAVENYPNLKASENFLQLQAALNETEEQIAAARRAFNAAVTYYNNAIEMFPTNIMASLMSYQRKQVFEAAAADRENVDVGAMFKK